jgi:hypothetical protein
VKKSSRSTNMNLVIAMLSMVACRTSAHSYTDTVLVVERDKQFPWTAFQALITQTRAKQAATMSEVEWRGRTVPVKIDKVRIFLLGLADNEAAIAQVRRKSLPTMLSCVCVWGHPEYSRCSGLWVFLSHKARTYINAVWELVSLAVYLHEQKYFENQL